jgi:hypothetical protein
MIAIPKANEKRDNFPCWHAAVNDKGNPINPIIYCVCGQPLALTPHHKVTEEGYVFAFHHQHPCGFYANPLKLIGWEKAAIESTPNSIGTL